MHSLKFALFAVSLAVTLSGCKEKEAAGEPASEPAPALSVDVLVLQAKPVRDTSEYLATLSSRSSVTLFPQVVGHVSQIFVKPGDRVKAGTALVQIDPTQEQAMLDQLVAARTLKAANLRYAGERARRAGALAGEGLASRQDEEQAAAAREAAAAELASAEAQIKAQASQLRFFKITAPLEGTVGDIPVKVGDLVTTSTRLTTVGHNAVLEAYVHVPVERARDLGADSSVQLVDASGASLGESPVTFVADQANVETQSLLIKGVFPNTAALKVAQLVRARVVWSTRPGLRLPTIAVMRQSGQAFAFVAAPEGGGAVARQRAVTLGAIEGNDFIVTSGLAAGDHVIVSSVQKLRDGGPVAPKG